MPLRPVLELPAALRAWNTPDFPAALKRELAAQADALPLQQALAGSSSVCEANVEVLFIGARADDGLIHAKVGVFFAGMVGGCSCADDPTPVEPQTEYCELLVEINRAHATATVHIAD